MMFSSVVLPELVPPEISTFRRALTQRSRKSAVSGVREPSLTRSSEVKPAVRELPDREQRAGQRQRRQHGVHAAAVRQAGVDHRPGLVDPAAHLSHHLRDDPAQVRVVVEVNARLVQLALTLDPDLRRPLTMISVIVSSASRRSSGPWPRMSSAISRAMRSRSLRARPRSWSRCALISASTRTRSVDRVGRRR